VNMKDAITCLRDENPSRRRIQDRPALRRLSQRHQCSLTTVEGNELGSMLAGDNGNTFRLFRTLHRRYVPAMSTSPDAASCVQPSRRRQDRMETA
jgi:hypothetical protein